MTEQTADIPAANVVAHWPENCSEVSPASNIADKKHIRRGNWL